MSSDETRKYLEECLGMLPIAWYSLTSNFYHTQYNCPLGKEIDRENLRSGTGDREICKQCMDLEAMESEAESPDDHGDKEN